MHILPEMEYLKTVITGGNDSTILVRGENNIIKSGSVLFPLSRRKDNDFTGLAPFPD
jgi:hypothetical protein